ncbi:MAG: lipocalin-like domain-containing protein [Marinobacter sp.]|uniref:lipocalin-like domain-containing protein n=1 Tax=Marinobacter sp. TaxID=50741 RepID=UPI00299ECDEE|nr:lipocalin-like domain-containing protein [Marinobacter sp.]MDX1634916.1 lipocalin-like domain-containing protein [Marinobacter sp.]
MMADLPQMTRSRRATLTALLLSLMLAACEPSSSGAPEGFAGLGESLSTAEQGDYRQPGPGDRIQLPEDLGPHPAHRIEWWYLTANLTTSAGEPLGLQWTQFRQALEPRSPQAPPPPASDWPLQAVWMAHAAVSLDGEHRFAERLARADIGHAGARATPFAVWLDHWQLRQTEAGHWRLQVSTGDWSFDLTLTPGREPVRHGDNGFSAKSASGEGSMYFSYVDLAIEGEVVLAGQRHQVSGTGWFDREWSSQFLKAGQQGWDWFALHLDSGDKLMAFRLRESGADAGGFRAGTWIPAGGEPVSLRQEDLRISAISRREISRGAVPSQWQLRLPDQGVELTVTARPGDYWNTGLFPYWESPVTVRGSHTGVGYMELTGYGD